MLEKQDDWPREVLFPVSDHFSYLNPIGVEIGESKLPQIIDADRGRTLALEDDSWVDQTQ